MATLLGGEVSSVEVVSAGGSKFVGDYEIARSIGQGAFGKVKLGIHQTTGEKVALKFVKKENLKTPKQTKGLIREVRLMKLLNHPHIVKVHDVMETDDSVVVVMEYVRGGELFDYIVAHGKLKTDEARKFFRQILSAIDYCHKNSITHRDLKPENLLMDEHDNIKITDFGFSNFYQEDSLLDTFCGSPCYMPPEMIQGIKYAGPKVDVWGLGIILYSLITGQLPFTGEDIKELYQNITKARFRCPHYVDEETRGIISQMLTADFEERISVTQLEWSPWVCRGYDGPPRDHLPPRGKIEVIDETALSELEDLHGTKTSAELQQALLANESGPVTAAYYLILEYLFRDESPSPQRKWTRESTRDSIAETVTEDSFNGRSSGESFKSVTSHLRTSNAKRSPSLDKIAPGTSPPARNRKLSLTEAIPKLLNFRPRVSSITGSEVKVKKGVFTVKTTSNKDDEEIAKEIERVLTENRVGYQVLAPRLFSCEATERQSESNFEIMICHIEKLGMNGLYFKRIRGNFWIHKQITDKLVSQMKL